MIHSVSKAEEEQFVGHADSQRLGPLVEVMPDSNLAGKLGIVKRK